MTPSEQAPAPTAEHVEHLDVLIIGAGLSGIGAACHLKRTLPHKTFAILEARESLGGTWDLFRYPGVRSDSDMFTLGYRFKPWPELEAIADGPSILRYVTDTAREYGVDTHIRYHHRVVRADWSSTDASWLVTIERTDNGDTIQLTCGFMFTCSGYYRYDQGYSPEFAGSECFTGQLVHPQHWPDDFDYAGKRVVVIGSGATAVTLVPAMADDAAHVTMLQRSPTYIITIPGTDAIANCLRRLLPAMAAYRLTRWKNVLLQVGFYQFSRRRPKLVRSVLRKQLRKQLPSGYDVDTHFNPHYNPWEQRLCLVPDGDLFTALGNGSASIVTGTIDTFTEHGIRLSAGEELDADVVITATGLNLLPFGGIDLVVDGEPVKLPETLAYKGVMLSDVPNFAYVMGYTNASWTLKADLACEYICRLLAHMDANDYDRCLPARESGVGEEPFVDLAAGYILRSLDELPKQGTVEPWKLQMNHLRDTLTLRYGPIEDRVLTFGASHDRSTAGAV